jgi:hypothetical protein
MQRGWKTEGAIENGQCREGGKPKRQSRMDNVERVENRRGNREWTMQRGWKTEGAIENGQCREGGNMVHKSHNE